MFLKDYQAASGQSHLNDRMSIDLEIRESDIEIPQRPFYSQPTTMTSWFILQKQRANAAYNGDRLVSFRGAGN